ncbi:DUF2442 domain-containing protein [Saccharicrinis aurantiacus]|uniref:DUF2442 domain-containing protein n=1 Tax=Saccharicrinis aurantiacus TaxID=1849719 RepID=UPI002490EED1|nr:DUF2442 domain-containing protein [Saccharicrinis aurantiacus]
MRISVEYSKPQSQFSELRINSAKYLADYVIRISFNDGTRRVVDFKPFLIKALHPSMKKYLDESNFAQFSILDGNLNWNDYDLIFPISDLYNGEIIS